MNSTERVVERKTTEYGMRRDEVDLYHKGHGNLKSALPSDTSKLIGGIGRHSAKHRMISSLKSINP